MQKRYIALFRPRGNVDFAVGKANPEIFLIMFLQLKSDVRQLFPLEKKCKHPKIDVKNPPIQKKVLRTDCRIKFFGF